MIRLLGGVRGLSQEQEPLGQDTSHRGVRSPSGLTGHPPNQRRPRLPSRAHLLPPPYAHTHSPSLLTWIPDVFQVRNKVAEISVFSIIVDLQEKHRAVKPTGDETSGTVPMKPSVWCSERLGRAKGARRRPLSVPQMCREGNLAVLCYRPPGLTSLFQAGTI